MKKNNNKVPLNKTLEDLVDYEIKRFKSFTWNHIVLLVFLVLMFAGLLWLMIGMSISLSKGLSLFGSADGVKNQATAFDITILTVVVIFVFIFNCLIGYYLLFSPIIKLQPEDKTIVNGKVLVAHQSEEEIKEQKEDNSVIDVFKDSNQVIEQKEHKENHKIKHIEEEELNLDDFDESDTN